MQTKLNQAEKLILEGHRARARDLLRQAIDQAPESKVVYQDAVNILMLAQAYDDALPIIEAYERRFGAWRGDFGRDEIRNKSIEAAGLEKNPTKVFVRQRFLQRGGPPAYWTFFPVQRLALSPNALTVTRLRVTRIYDWASGIEVLTRDVHKIGAYGPADGRRKWCNIHTPDGLSNVFDVSAVNSDFAFPNILLNALALHVGVREGRWSEFRACLLGKW